MTPEALFDALTPLLDADALREARRVLREEASSRALVAAGLLSKFQAAEVDAGRGEGLVVGFYVLLDKIGEGGMGEVFRARHRETGQVVALKRIHSRRLGSATAVARFGREVESAKRLAHPSFVAVHDSGEHQGWHFLTMDLLEGESLSDHLKRKGRLPAAEAVGLVRQACDGMAHAHERGLVHRDLKPANLWICPGGIVKILDLGLARVEDDKKLTRLGIVLGTVDYIAPEQVKDPRDVDARADVYSLGCTLYQLLCGKPPFDEAHPSARPMMHVSATPTAVQARQADVPAEVAAVVAKMMAREREQRYASAAEASRALGDAMPSKPLTTAERSGSRLMLYAALLAVAFAAFVATAFSFALKRRGDDKGQVVKKDEPKKAELPLKEIASLTGDAKPGRPDADKGKPSGDVVLATLGDTFTNDLGMCFVRIKAGKFVMGSSKEEEARFADESQHEVTITKDFWMGVTEVTQKQYRTVTGENPSYFCKEGGGKGSVNGLDTDDFPVETVSWQDARIFLDALNVRAKKEKSGVEYRLPTEAEWEYTCRGGRSNEPTHFGKSLSSKQANLEGNSPYGGAAKGVYLRRTTKVASYPPNAFGLYDMHGNVWEWCADWYGPYPEGAVSDPSGPPKGARRVNRGGSWSYTGQRCRSAQRLSFTPLSRLSSLGFRVAAVPAS